MKQVPEELRETECPKVCTACQGISLTIKCAGRSHSGAKGNCLTGIQKQFKEG